MGSNKDGTVATATLSVEQAYQAAWNGVPVVRTQNVAPESGQKSAKATGMTHRDGWQSVVYAPDGDALAKLEGATNPGSNAGLFQAVDVPKHMTRALRNKGYVVTERTDTDTGEITFSAEAPNLQARELAEIISRGDDSALTDNPIRARNTAGRTLPRYGQTKDVRMQLCGRPADRSDTDNRTRRLVLTGHERADGKDSLVGTVMLRSRVPVETQKKHGRNKISYQDGQVAIRVWVHACRNQYGKQQARISALVPDTRHLTDKDSRVFAEIGTIVATRQQKKQRNASTKKADRPLYPGLVCRIDMQQAMKAAYSESFISPGGAKEKQKTQKPEVFFLDALDASWLIEHNILPESAAEQTPELFVAEKPGRRDNADEKTDHEKPDIAGDQKREDNGTTHRGAYVGHQSDHQPDHQPGEALNLKAPPQHGAQDGAQDTRNAKRATREVDTDASMQTRAAGHSAETAPSPNHARAVLDARPKNMAAQGKSPQKKSAPKKGGFSSDLAGMNNLPEDDEPDDTAAPAPR